MYRLYRYPFLFLLIIIFTYQSATTQEVIRKFDVKWKAPLGLEEESTYIPSLYFEGAAYSDSLPQVPVVIHRTPITIPHFTYEYAVG
ncbi:MAG: hypothetical protein ABR597_14110, partial [Bacteroidales bacterium]